MLSYVMFVNKEKIVRKTILKMQDRVNSETHGTRLQTHIVAYLVTLYYSRKEMRGCLLQVTWKGHNIDYSKDDVET